MNNIIRLLLILVLLSTSVFAEEILEPTSVGGDLSELGISTEPTPEEIAATQARIDAREAKYRLFNITIAILGLLSLVLTYNIAKLLIKLNSKIIIPILHGIIFLASLIGSVIATYDFARSNEPFLVVAMWLIPMYLIAIISGLILWKRKKFSTNISIAVPITYIIFLILSGFAESIIQPQYDLPGTLGLIFLAVLVVPPLYAIFAGVGFYLDRN